MGTSSLPGADDSQRSRGPSRRSLLIGGGVAALGVATGAYVRGRTGSVGIGETAVAVSPFGDHQAGIARPNTPQPHTHVAVCDASGVTTRAQLSARLEDASNVIVALVGATAVADSAEASAPGEAGDLTVTVGLGPRLAVLWDADSPVQEALPAFAGDETIALENNGGDVLISACATDAAVLTEAVTRVAAALDAAPPRWEQFGFRAPGEGTVARNPLGFFDGIAVPRTEEDVDANVWIPSGSAAGGTVAVIRQLRLDVESFASLAQSDQEATIGRHKATGAPLTGGDMMDDVNLQAKTPEGDFITPARSHARAAHPSFTGSNLMLRRGYAYNNGPMEDGKDDEGLLFVCFQREVDDFVRTQLRMDEQDDLMQYATAVSSGVFLVLPGFSPDTPLGATSA